MKAKPKNPNFIVKIRREEIKPKRIKINIPVGSSKKDIKLGYKILNKTPVTGN